MAAYFLFQRQPASVAFCTFFFFENFLNVAAYMADSRRMELQYVTVGNPEFAEHDWAVLFGQMGVLQYDMQIAAVVRAAAFVAEAGTAAGIAAKGVACGVAGAMPLLLFTFCTIWFTGVSRIWKNGFG